MELSSNAETVLERRYLRKNNRGDAMETPEDMFDRVASHIAMGDTDLARKFYKMMTDLRFLPNSPTLMNAGRELGQLAACFVLPIEDSMDGIFTTLKNTALIHKSGGGTGFNFSKLRAKNSMVGSTGGVASGPVSFMKVFNTATEQVKQGGTRRGANMGVLRVDHPDIMEFITCKKDNDGLNNFNISVAITDKFMKAVENDTEYGLIDPKNGEECDELNAKKVYNILIENAWSNGDPGVIFIDEINRHNPTPGLGDIECTNPCGEQPLLPNEACNLGSINLTKFVDENSGIRYNMLAKTIITAMYFLDNTISVGKYPLPEIDEMVKGNRKIGLGVMGFADMLYMMGIPYNSQQALVVAEDVMSFIHNTAWETSEKMGKDKGCFPNSSKSVYSAIFRNATTTTIAPTGTLSIIANCSSGIEPAFALSYVRNIMDNDKLIEVNPYFEKVMKDRGIYSVELMDKISKSGSIQHIDGIPEDVKKVFVTSHDISPEYHVRMQAAFQRYNDSAVSKTVNLPREATKEEVRNVYDLAYELKCKGVTIYRDGSMENQVLSFSEAEKKSATLLVEAAQNTAYSASEAAKSMAESGKLASKPIIERPEILEGFTAKIKTGMGNLYVTVTECEGRPFEVFATIGKSGKSVTAKTEAIGRLVSLALRSGIHVEKVIDQLKGICGEHPVFQEGGMVLSIPDAIGKILDKRYINKKEITKTTCPECGNVIVYEEGCVKCYSCGYSKCS